MTGCADCGQQVGARAVIYVDPNGQYAKTVCYRCRSKYPRKRTYSPMNSPTQSRYDISDRGRT